MSIVPHIVISCGVFVFCSRFCNLRIWADKDRRRRARDMSKSYCFQDLAPKNDANDLGCYEEALKYAFSKADIRNIALSGTYGSGKSTIIRSYEKKHTEQKFIHISLAHFDEQGNNTDINADPENLNDIVRDLEGKILNQLIHQIPPKNIPQSHFRIKKEVSWLQRILTICGLLSFAVALLYLICFESWSAYIKNLSDSGLKSVLTLSTNSYGQLVAGALCFALVGISVFYLFKTHNFRNVFKKVDLKGVVGIEIFETSSDSYFDKYLNEVLYLFEHANADAIVFEDLDRYDVTLIFEKLHEISNLLYSRSRLGKKQQNKVLETLKLKIFWKFQHKDKKSIRFLYLIRDDVFTSADRSKFFDFIIPVIPYVDVSNSCDQLIQCFRESNIESDFSERFLQDVSLYISDMRLIRNIVNEYIIYNGRLDIKKITPQPDRLLAMMIYKNLYPEDFNLLLHGRGYVFTLLQNKEILIQKRSAQIESEIRDLKQRIADSDREKLESIDELNALYFPLSENITSINGQNVEHPADRVNLIKSIISNPENVQYRLVPPYNGIRTFDVNNRMEEMNNNKDYIRRKILIEDQNHQKQLIEEISRLIQEKALLSTMSIAELLNDNYADESAFWNIPLPSYEKNGYADSVKKTPGFDLLKYLIRNGYINEDYAANISYFYPNSLTIQDRNFLLALKDRKNLGYEYHLDRPKTVLDRLNSEDFIHEEVQNFDLFEYLLQNRCDALTDWLHYCDQNKSSSKFLIEFWRTGRVRQAFTYTINVEMPDWFHNWSENNLLQGIEWKMFALDSIYYLGQSQLTLLNQNEWLTKRISKDPKFLQVDTPNVELIVQALETLNIRFEQLDYREQDLELLHAIYESNLYVLNLSNLKTFLGQYWNISGKLAESCSYTYLKKKPKEPLAVRVFNNMEEYMTVILEESAETFIDDEHAVIELLNDGTYSDEKKNRYIKRMRTVLSKISNIEDISLWPALLKHLKCTWENVVEYFIKCCEDNEISQELSDFINSDKKKLAWNYRALNKKIGEEKASQFRKALLRCESIPLDRYRSILESMEVIYNTFPIVDLPAERMKIVLDHKMIAMNSANLKIIRNNYPNLLNDFIVTTGPSQFAQQVKDGELDITREELVALLEDRRLDQDTAFLLLGTFGEVPVEGKRYLPAVKAKIIEDHFDAAELPSLLRSFDKEDLVVKRATIQYVQTKISELVDASEQENYIPVDVYAACLDSFTVNQALSLRSCLSNKYFETVCKENKQPKFSNTDVNRKILNYFKKQGWISSFTVHNGFIRAYPKISAIEK